MMKVYNTQVRYWFKDAAGFSGDLTKKELGEAIDFAITIALECDEEPVYEYGIYSMLTTYEDGTEEFKQY